MNGNWPSYRQRWQGKAGLVRRKRCRIPLRHTKPRCAALNQSRFQSKRYVTLGHGGYQYNRRLGNMMFSIVAVLYVAQLTGRTPALQKVDFNLSTDNVFDSVTEIERVKLPDLCPCSTSTKVALWLTTSALSTSTSRFTPRARLPCTDSFRAGSTPDRSSNACVATSSSTTTSPSSPKRS